MSHAKNLTASEVLAEVERLEVKKEKHNVPFDKDLVHRLEEQERKLMKEYISRLHPSTRTLV